MDDPARAAERIMPWEYRHPHTDDFEDILRREHEASIFPGAGIWPLLGPDAMYHFPPFFR